MGTGLPFDDVLVAAQAGAPWAFEVLYRRYRDCVFSLALRFSGGNREDALDVLQEAFAYFLKKAPALELRCRLKTFLYPVVKHLALNRPAIVCVWVVIPSDLREARGATSRNRSSPA